MGAVANSRVLGKALGRFLLRLNRTGASHDRGWVEPQVIMGGWATPELYRAVHLLRCGVAAAGRLTPWWMGVNA